MTAAEGKKTRRCWVYLGTFEKDLETLQGMQPIKISIGDEGHVAQAAVLADHEIRMCVQDVSLLWIFISFSGFPPWSLPSVFEPSVWGRVVRAAARKRYPCIRTDLLYSFTFMYALCVEES